MASSSALGLGITEAGAMVITDVRDTGDVDMLARAGAMVTRATFAVGMLGADMRTARWAEVSTVQPDSMAEAVASTEVAASMVAVDTGKLS
jgi:hypothetical protein